MPESPRWKIIVFVRKGKKLERIVKDVKDPRKAQDKVNELLERGIKAHVVCKRAPNFPPKGEPEDESQLWCPYCRRWRYFSVPRNRGAFTTLNIRCCQWCWISEDEFSVKKFNGTWDGSKSRRRSKKARRKRTRV